MNQFRTYNKPILLFFTMKTFNVETMIRIVST